MASYYYLMSSLPMLKSDGEIPFKYSEFLSMCKNSVSGRIYGILENLTPSSKDGPLLSEWANFYGALSEELSYERNVRLGNPASAPIFKDDSASHIVSAAMNEKNPLVAENLLLSYEFEKLDLLIGIHQFDDYALIGYALKLKLLERKAVFVDKDGKTELKQLLKDLEQKIKKVR